MLAGLSGKRATGLKNMTASPYVLLDDSLTPGGRSLLYTEPERIVVAYTPEEVEAKLDEVSAGRPVSIRRVLSSARARMPDFSSAAARSFASPAR